VLFVRSMLLVPIVLGIMAPLLFKIHIYKSSETIYHLLSGICHQAYSRSFWVAGVPIGICARCSGIYIGLFLSSFGSLFNYKCQYKYTFGLLLIIPLAIEKTAFSSFSISNTIRFIVGILVGFGGGIVFYSLIKKLIFALNIFQKEV